MGRRSLAPDSRSRLAWWLFAVGLAAALVVSLRGYLGWAVFGLFVYHVARPVARWLQRRGLSPTAAAVLTMGLVIVPFVALLVATTAYALLQLAALEPTDVERVLDTLFPRLTLEDPPTSPADVYVFTRAFWTDPTVEPVVGWLGNLLGTFARQAYSAGITGLVVFFLLRDERRIGGWLQTTLLDGRPNLTEYARAIDRGLTSVYFGYTLTLFVITLAAALVYHALNLVAPPGLAIPRPMLLAIATGIISAIPLVGRTLLYAIVIVYLSSIALRSDPMRLWFPALFFVIMWLLFDNLIRIYVRPYLSGRLFPIGLVMLGYLLGPPLFGWYGVFLGPLVMVVVVQFLRYRLPTLVNPDDPAG